MRTVTKQSLDFDRKYTQKRIEDCMSKIKALEEQIEGYNSKLREIEKLENELSEYKKRPIAERTITTFISKTSATIDIMDRFEDKNEKGFKKYDRMVVKNIFHYNDEYSFNLIIERKGDRETVGSITMTDFKLNYPRSLIAHAKEEIRKAAEENKEKLCDGKEIIFNLPYLLRAQNSSNRTGYGNIYNGESLVYEGTLYGETTSYVFAGAKIIDNKKREDEMQRRREQWRTEFEERRRKQSDSYKEIIVGDDTDLKPIKEVFLEIKSRERF